jgi:hypothetical protein
MKKLKTSYWGIICVSLILSSCGPSADDYTTENLKSTCDCVKMNTELQKNYNDLLEAEPDKAKRKELQESDKLREWTKKKMEIISYCSKNLEYKLDAMTKCPEFEELSKELKRDHELYLSDDE